MLGHYRSPKFHPICIVRFRSYSNFLWDVSHCYSHSSQQRVNLFATSVFFIFCISLNEVWHKSTTAKVLENCTISKLIVFLTLRTEPQNHRKVGVGRDLHLLSQAGLPRASCPQTRADRFWRSTRRENPQLLRANYISGLVTIIVK